MKQLLDGVTLYLNAGERVGLIGVNGTGKSTFLKILAGVEDPDSGRVTRDPNVQISYLRKALRNDASVQIESLMKKGYILKE